MLFPDRPPRVVALADAAAIVLFALAGVVSHRGGVAAGALAHDALPILAGWFAAAFALGAYRRRSVRALLLTWLAGVTLGVALRAAILDRPLGGREAAFLGTSLAFTLVFVAAARLLVRLAPGTLSG